MNTDSRRLQVPQVSTSPYQYYTQPSAPLVDADGARQDGRYSAESRCIFLQCGIVSQAKGSCYCELDKTKVICSVYGPKDVERREEFQMEGRIKCEFKFATFSCKERKGHIQDLDENELSMVITQALSASVRLQMYPKSLIEVYVMVLENDGSVLAASLMSSSLAVADACLEQYDIITAASLRVCGKDDFIEDPVENEEYHPQSCPNTDLNHGTLTVALLPVLNQICAVVSNGHLESGVLMEAMDTCVNSARNLYSIARKCLLSSVKSVSSA